MDEAYFAAERIYIMLKKYFIITIDTEGDNLWNVKDTERKIRNITNKNGLYIERFQELCEKYGFIPSYLTNYEMSQSELFVDMAKKGLNNKTLEIGMHMHAWNSPPYYKLEFQKNGNNAYLGEYPHKIIKEKLKFLTETLEDTFSVKMTSHRGGRWFLNDYILKCLEELGYLTDCTVSPGVSWNDNVGYTKHSKGRNWSRFEDKVFYLQYKNILKGKSNILEIPATIREKEKNYKVWMRPNGKNLKDLLWLTDEVYNTSGNYLEFMLHSSELMPGGSPTFKTKKDIERLYHDLEILFQHIKSKFVGIGLTDFAKKYI